MDAGPIKEEHLSCEILPVRQLLLQLQALLEVRSTDNSPITFLGIHLCLVVATLVPIAVAPASAPLIKEHKHRQYHFFFWFVLFLVSRDWLVQLEVDTRAACWGGGNQVQFKSFRFHFPFE